MKFEAGVCKLTVISTRVGEMPYFIEDGINGFLIDNGTDLQIKTDVIDRLIRLSKDRTLLQTMKNNLFKTTIEKYSFEKNAVQWEKFFDKCFDAFELNKESDIDLKMKV